jgi:butyryl-CoA dehydrogenase
LKLGTRNIGGAKHALTRAVRYAVERRQFGRAIAEFGLIKQKLAGMTVCCYIGDAMVYRTLGDVDRALEAIDQLDHDRVLKAIEGYAVECSINKVWTSEALASVVDESLQVFGGYGYSQEFPAERAYRDARITRIYEGTNEINRLIITTRLLRNGPRVDASVGNCGNETPFTSERGLLTRGKCLVRKLLTCAQDRFGDSLPNEQELCGFIADMIIELYAVESGVLRTEKLLLNRDKESCAVPIDITHVYAIDAFDRFQHAAKQAANAIPDNSEYGALISDIRSLSDQAPFDAVAARRRIADAVIRSGRYYL